MNLFGDGCEDRLLGSFIFSLSIQSRQSAKRWFRQGSSKQGLYQKDVNLSPVPGDQHV